MSRTFKTDPWRVRVARLGLSGVEPHHSHWDRGRAGCDLPSLKDSKRAEETRCFWLPGAEARCLFRWCDCNWCNGWDQRNRTRQKRMWRREWAAELAYTDEQYWQDMGGLYDEIDFWDSHEWGWLSENGTYVTQSEGYEACKTLKQALE